ncbi:hypothetical protein H2O64_02135 [Kordia sp. YSTF-M3]|uniref:Uncharacterized protein n=1 Tax=Kordia aestuariivivens TaxID=2759037 RepID=A0ABR7Q4H7_9FLAO|nr:hypothetical protein [Kordia aestuariivivens]MBC8753452.1 hypothetical protein [Kordia aestuariivivens]
MKKQKINNLQLNKKSISNFTSTQVKGKGYDPVYLTNLPTMIFYFNDKGECLCLSVDC